MPDDRRSPAIWPAVLVVALLAMYVGGYFGLSQSEVIGGTQARMFPNRTRDRRNRT